MAESDNTETTLRDRAMKILLELQAEEREVNATEKQALAALDQKAERHRRWLGLDEESE